MPLISRISEASKQINEWLKSLEVAFNNEKDKLQMIKWELNDREYRYHYLIIKGKELSASSVGTQLSGQARGTSKIQMANSQMENSLIDFSLH